MSEDICTSGWISTASGGQWFIREPKQSDVRIEDIAHALAQTNRFAGHARFPYSVAQHSILVARAIEEDSIALDPLTVLWGLMHDSPEAYLGDVTRPLKAVLSYYKCIEAHTENVILSALRIPHPCQVRRTIVKRWDNRLLMTERRDLVNHSNLKWDFSESQYAPLAETIIPWPWDKAKEIFLEEYLRIRSLMERGEHR